MLSRKSYPFHVIAPWGVVILFVLKASITGIWVVRPWDVPDEVGHFSYIRDLATGKGLPVLHESSIDQEVWKSFAPESQPNPGKNWIAQHPPLYYLVMVPVYGLGAIFGSAFWGSFFLIRIATAVIFAAGIWALMKAIRETGIPSGVALGFGIMVASIPSHTYLAAGVNHDAMVFMLGSFVLLYWIRFAQSGSSVDLTYLGLFLGLGGVVKYTFLVLYPPVLCLTAFTVIAKKDFSREPIIRFLLLAVFPIGLWICRNLIVYGVALPIDTSGFQSDQPYKYSLLEFGQEFAVFSILLQTFWGLLGWMGDGTFLLRWLQIYPIYQKAFTWPITLLLCVTLFYLVREGIADRKRLLYSIVFVSLLLFLAIMSGWLGSEHSQYQLLFYIGIVVFAWRVAGFLFCLGNKKLGTNDLIETGSLCILIFFLGVHFYKIYSFSISAGSLQGTFGRYYLPVVGFAVIGFLTHGVRRFPLAPQLVLSLAMVYTCTELYVWLHEAIPFFYLYE